MSDRTCARGCTQRGIHWATCDDYGRPEEDHTCKGCAPRECRDGSLVCDKCFGQARRLLDDLPDLIARIRSIIDPSKATPTDKEPGGGRSSEPIAAVGSDPLDAVIACENVWSLWGRWGEDLPLMSNRVDALYIFDLILERHRPKDGLRPWWSVQDAVDAYGVERRPGRNEKPWEDDDDAELATFPIPEWGGLVTREDAAKIAGSRPTLYRWVADNKLRPAMDYRNGDGTKTTLFRASDVEHVRKEMAR